MRSTTCLIVVGLIVSIQAQTETERNPSLVVLKFSCGAYREPSNVIRSVHEPDLPVESLSTNRLPRNETQEQRNRRDIGERRAELARVEKNAALSTNRSSKTYLYHLEIQNGGTRTIKSFALEYQPTGGPEISNRQFFCVVNAKPNERKGFDLLSPLAPSHIVDASSAGRKPDKNAKDLVIINKVEYADGSIWVRRGWNPKTFSADVTDRIGTGQCVGL